MYTAATSDMSILAAILDRLGGGGEWRTRPGPLLA